MTQQQQILDFIVQTANDISIIDVIQHIPDNYRQSVLIEFIKNTSTENQRRIYYTIMPITLTLPTDVLQYIISYNNINIIKLINRLFYTLATKNETKYYTELHKNIENKISYRVTHIVNNKRNILHKSEISHGYVGPYKNVDEAIIAAKHNDRILIHPGVYYVKNTIKINKNIELTGLTSKNDIYNNYDVTIYLQRKIIITWNTITFKNLAITTLDTYAMVIMNKAAIIADNCKFHYKDISLDNNHRAVIIIHPECTFKCTKCYFRYTEEAILISMKAKEISIKNSEFQYNTIAQYYNGCVVIQDHWDAIFTDNMIVKLEAIDNVFNITEDKMPFIEINENPNQQYVLYNHGTYLLKNNHVICNTKSVLNPNKLYLSNLPDK